MHAQSTHPQDAACDQLVQALRYDGVLEGFLRCLRIVLQIVENRLDFRRFEDRLDFWVGHGVTGSLFLTLFVIRGDNSHLGLLHSCITGFILRLDF